MGCRRGVLEHRVVAVVLARLARVLAQPLNTKVAQAESFNLRNVNGSIAVNEVGGGAVSLVAGNGAVLVGPRRPLLSEVLKKQVAERLTIVTNHFHVTTAQFGQVLFKLIAATFLELIQKRWRPSSICHLV